MMSTEAGLPLCHLAQSVRKSFLGSGVCNAPYQARSQSVCKHTSEALSCSVGIDSHIYMFRLGMISQTLEPAKGLEVQVHHLISLGGWNDVISIYLVPGLITCMITEQ
jgi:hypothetical protein